MTVQDDLDRAISRNNIVGVVVALENGARIVNNAIVLDGILYPNSPWGEEYVFERRDHTRDTLYQALENRARPEIIDVLLAAGADPEQLMGYSDEIRNSLIERRNRILAERNTQIEEVTNRITEVGTAVAQGLYKETFQNEEFRNRSPDQVSHLQERRMNAISILERLTTDLVLHVASYLVNDRAFGLARFLPQSTITWLAQNQASTSPLNSSYFLDTVS